MSDDIVRDDPETKPTSGETETRLTSEEIDAALDDATTPEAQDVIRRALAAEGGHNDASIERTVQLAAQVSGFRQTLVRDNEVLFTLVRGMYRSLSNVAEWFRVALSDDAPGDILSPGILEKCLEGGEEFLRQTREMAATRDIELDWRGHFVQEVAPGITMVSLDDPSQLAQVLENLTGAGKERYPWYDHEPVPYWTEADATAAAAQGWRVEDVDGDGVRNRITCLEGGDEDKVRRAIFKAANAGDALALCAFAFIHQRRVAKAEAEALLSNAPSTDTVQ
jgi:hypothetical protein|tara:strand:- start:12072 stop:12911 length:840 start_codon:yes stop_codon:yes gene_type:complete